MNRRSLMKVSFVSAMVITALVMASTGLSASASAEEEAPLFTYNFTPPVEYTSEGQKGSMEINHSGGNETITKITLSAGELSFKFEEPSRKNCEKAYVGGIKCTVNIKFVATASCPHMEHKEGVRVTYTKLLAYESILKGTD